MLSRVFMVVNHVASQLIYRWFSAPLFFYQYEHSFFGQNLSLSNISLRDWKEFIKEMGSLFPRFVPGINLYLKRVEANISILSKAIYEHVHFCNDKGISYVTLADPDYPELLKMIPDPPLALTISGDVSLLKKRMIAVIGSRKASGFAIKESFELGRGLTEKGFSIVSGGAYGCDIAVHQGVLEGCKKANRAIVPAVIVFAGGLQEFYPKGNRVSFSYLKDGKAAFISERLWNAQAKPVDFPVRNRIISGLCDSIVVMQAGENSGAIITARCALDQGRDVAVLIHPENDVRSLGGNQLIKDGAHSFSSAEDLLEAM